MSIKPDVNSVTPEFWKMVQVANWKSMIKSYQNSQEPSGSLKIPYMLLLEQPKKRLYFKYDFNELKKFLLQYDIIYYQLYDYFKSSSDGNIGDDSYSDLLSSIIGRGKTFTQKCIQDKLIFYEMISYDDYVENFRYLLNIDKGEYDEIKEKYDPFYKSIKNYNL